MKFKRPKNMRFIKVIKENNKPKLILEECAFPLLKSYEVLIKVHAAGINRPDIFQKLGLYPPPKGASPILGLELAGEVVQIGKKVTEWAIGDRICALTTGGAYAQYCAVPQSQCLPIPKDFSLVEAASLPEVYFTVYFNLVMQNALTSGETLLIHGGSSGIGTAAIQLAKSLGVTVIITAGNEEKCSACRELGADFTINYKKDDFEGKIQNLKNESKISGVDLILDMVGGEYTQKNLNLLNQGGRLINIAYLQGFKIELNMLPILVKNLKMTGSTLRPQSLDIKKEIRDLLLTNIWPKFENKTIKPVIAQVFKLKNAEQAHQLMQSSAHIGKIILKTH